MSTTKSTTQRQPTHAPWKGWKTDTKRHAGRHMYGLAQRQVFNELRADLERNGKLTSEQTAFLGALRDGAENTVRALMYGLEGLGDFLGSAARSTDTPSNRSLEHIGWMLQEIADTMIGAEDLLGSAIELSALQQRAAMEDGA